MVLNTPLARAVAEALAPSTAVRAATKSRPARTVLSSSTAESAATHRSGRNASPHRTADSDTPRCARRFCICLRASASRPETVPSFHPNWPAASVLLLPSRQQSRNGARYFSGNRCSSSSSTACNSRHASSEPCLSCGIGVACLSCACRRLLSTRAFMAVR